MFKNYLKMAFRNLQRQKGYSLINIIGLAVGIAGCWLIFLFVSREMSYDRHWPGHERIYRVAEEIKSSTASRQFAGISFPYAPAVKSEFSEVEAAARIFSAGTRLMEKDEKKFYESGVLFADAEILNIFTFPLVEGDPATALAKPNTAVISEQAARKYFGPESPLGKSIVLDGRAAIQITGVFKQLPASSHLKFEELVSLSTLRTVLNQEFDNWFNTMAYTYIKLKAGTNVPDFERRMSGLAYRHVGDRIKSSGKSYRYFLQPVTSIHLQSNLRFELEPAGSTAVLSILSAAAIFILIIAGLNFVSLSTARSVRRAREIGLRKVIGATRKQLISQLLGESAFLAVLAALTAAALTVAVLQAFNDLAGTDFSLPGLLSPRFLVFSAIIVLLTGLGAGIYPALVLSSFRPAATLKGYFKSGRWGIRMRRWIVVGQFFATALLITGTLVVVQQIQFMKEQNLGFNKEQKIILPFLRGDQALSTRLEDIKSAFLRHSAIRGAAASSSAPGRIPSSFSVGLEDRGANSNWDMTHLFVDQDFIPLYQMTMVAGRAFDINMTADRTTDFDKPPVFIVNEAAVRAFGFTSAAEALGIRIRTGYGTRVGRIIGVVRDFHYTGLQQAITPLVMEWLPRMYNCLTLSVDTANLRETMAIVKNEWNAKFPGLPLESYFLDEDFNRQYEADDRLLAIVRVFTILGIFVSCLGLFGLSAFLAEQRTKEIGIRKVLGATASGIAIRFSNNFAGLVLLANALAMPAAWLIMNRWLQSYAYHASIPAWTFMLATAISLAVTFLTVSCQSIRAAVANPADSLRSE